MSRRRLELIAIAAIALLALLVRYASSREVPFYDYDAGLFFARIVEDLGDIWAGRGDGQYGASHPVYPMIGLPVVVRVFRDALGLETATAGQLVVLVASVGLVPIAASLARRAMGPAAAVLAAAMVALDAAQIEYSVRSYNVLPCAALIGAALVVLLHGEDVSERVRRSAASAAMAGALAGLAAFIRADAFAAGLVLAARVAFSARARRLPRGAAAAFFAAWTIATAAGFAAQRTVVVRNSAASYLDHVHADALYNDGQLRDAYDVDETGLTLRIASHPPELTPAQWLVIWARVQARPVGERCARELGPFLLGAALAIAAARGRRGLLGLVLGLCTAPLAVAVLVGAPAEDMQRYSIMARPLLLTVISCGVVVAADRIAALAAASGRALSRDLLLAPVFVLSLALWPPWSIVAIARSEASQGGRERVAAVARDIARVLPPRTRVACGPSADTICISLAGARPVHLASGPDPASVASYVRGNGLEWIIFDRSRAPVVERLLPGLRVEPAFAFATGANEAQILARIRR
jgi:hypothetical protein